MNEDVSKIETITKRISKISVHNMKKKREKKTHSHIPISNGITCGMGSNVKGCVRVCVCLLPYRIYEYARCI